MDVDDIESVTSISRRHSTRDFLKDFAVPLVPVAGMFLSLNSETRFRLFGAVAIILGLGTLSPRILAWSRAAWERSREKRLAKAQLPRFRAFVRQFGDFVNTGTNDTLHAIVLTGVSEQTRSALQGQFQVPPVHFWNGLWYHFSLRVSREQPSLRLLVDATQEFNHFIGQYHAFCVAAVFDRSGHTLESISKADKRKLNGFLDAYRQFTVQYREFMRELSQSHPSLQHLPHFLPMSDPLA